MVDDNEGSSSCVLGGWTPCLLPNVYGVLGVVEKGGFEVCVAARSQVRSEGQAGMVVDVVSAVLVVLVAICSGQDKIAI